MPGSRPGRPTPKSQFKAVLDTDTCGRYPHASIWKVHVKDSIGSRQIAKLGPYDVERYLRDLKAQGLSEATVRQVRAVLRRSCRLARR